MDVRKKTLPIEYKDTIQYICLEINGKIELRIMSLVKVDKIRRIAIFEYTIPSCITTKYEPSHKGFISEETYNKTICNLTSNIKELEGKVNAITVLVEQFEPHNNLLADDIKKVIKE